MSLNIYLKRSDIPSHLKFINYNDKFFSSVELQDSELIRDVLETIDRAQYNSKDTIIGRDKSLGALNKSFISTGCKTLINIITNPQHCFDVIECGQNALQKLITFKSGNVLWEMPVILVHGPSSCDVKVNNIQFTDTMSLAEYVTKIMLGEQ